MPIKTVQKALSRREKIQRLLDNLEGLKTSGEVEDGQYDVLKTQYTTLRIEAEDNLQTIRDGLQRRYDDVSIEIAEIDKEVQTVQLRAKVGELEPDEVVKRLKAIQRKRQTMAARQTELGTARAGQSSADVGGYVDVDVAQTVMLSEGISFERIAAKEAVGKAAAKLKQLGREGGMPSVLSRGSLPAGKRVLQQTAACIFCLVALLDLVSAFRYFRAARMVGGAQKVVEGLGDMVGVEHAAGGLGTSSSGFLYFTGVLLLAVTAAVVASIGGLFGAKEWSVRLTLITCAAGGLVAVLCLFAQGFYASILLILPAYIFGAYAVLDI